MNVPDLLEARTLLCVQPHYDDNDIAAGGTIARLHERGATIVYVTVTDDLVGVLDPALTDEQATARLRDEQRRAGDRLGVDRHHWLGYPDAGRYAIIDLRQDLVRILRMERPDFVLTCDPWLAYESHQDHVRCGLATAEAVSLQGLPRLATDPAVDEAYQPYTISGIGFYWTQAPNTTIDISRHRDAKHDALDCYRAQFRAEDLRLLHAALEHQEREWAHGMPYTHAECFKVLRPFQLHCNVNAARS